MSPDLWPACPRCGAAATHGGAHWYTGVADRWRLLCHCPRCGPFWSDDDPRLARKPPPPHRRYVRGLTRAAQRAPTA